MRFFVRRSANAFELAAQVRRGTGQVAEKRLHHTDAGVFSKLRRPFRFVQTAVAVEVQTLNVLRAIRTISHTYP